MATSINHEAISRANLKAWDQAHGKWDPIAHLYRAHTPRENGRLPFRVPKPRSR